MTKRNYEMDFMKLLFAVLIVFCHAHGFFGWEYCVGGAIGVDFFFVVSGYFFARSVKRAEEQPCANESLGGETWRFIKRKVSAFYPYLIFAVIFAFVLRHIADAASAATAARDAVNSVWEVTLLQAAGFSGYWPTGVAWYLSALILASWILYPIARRKKSLFFKWICPLAVILINGIISKTCGGTRGSTDFLFGFASRGILRGASELCLGCICFEGARWLRKQSLTAFARVCLNVVQVAGYGAVFLMGWLHEASQYDFIMLLLIAVSVTITMSGQNYTQALFRGKLDWMGKLSLTLYLCHACWAIVIGSGGLFAGMDMNVKAALYFGLALVSAVVCLAVVDGLKAWAANHGEVMKKLFVKKISGGGPSNG